MNATVSTGLSPLLSPTVVELSANQIACIKEFAAHKDVRYYLNAIHFRTDGSRAYLTACDGHMGAILRTPEGSVSGPDIGWVVPIELFERLTKDPITITFAPPAANGTEPDADPEAGLNTSEELKVGHWCCEVTLAQGDTKRSIQSLAAHSTYPAMAGVFPSETGNVAVQLDQALVARIYKAYAALKSGDGMTRRRKSSGINAHPIFGYPNKADGVVMLDFRDPDFIGLVMPLRGMEKVSPPDWLTAYGDQHQVKPLLEAATAVNQAREAKRQAVLEHERKAQAKKEVLAVRAEQALKRRQALMKGQAVAPKPSVRLPARIQVPQAMLGKASGYGSGLGAASTTVSVPWREVSRVGASVGAGMTAV